MANTCFVDNLIDTLDSYFVPNVANFKTLEKPHVALEYIDQYD